MLPGDLVVGGPSGPYLPPDNLSYSRLLDFESGGAALGDASQGLTGYVWEVSVAGDDIRIRRGTDAYTPLFSMAHTYELALAFDQNMRPVVAVATRNKDLHLYWYDPVAAAHVLTSLGHGRSPRLTLDDKRPGADPYNDVILGYVSGKVVKYRQQRDRFATEYSVVSGIPGHARLHQLGMGTNLRVQFKVA